MPSLKENKLNFLEKLFLVLVVLSSGTDAIFDFSVIYYALILCYLLLVATHQINIMKCQKQILFCFIAMVIWTFQFLAFDYSISQFGSAAKYILLIFVSITFFVDKNIKPRFDFLMKVILFFSITATVLYLLYLVGIPVPVTYTKVHGSKTILYLSHFSYSDVYGISGIRLSGIYWEPGMYQIYLNLLLLYYLYSDTLKGYKKIILLFYLGVCILSTGSVTGYFLLAGLIVLYAVNNSRSIPIKALLIVLMVVFIFVFYPILDEILNNKMTMGKSYLYRTSDIYFGWEVFKNKPIFGYGISNKVFVSEFTQQFGALRSGNSNGWMNILINFGIVGMAAYCLCLLRTSKWFMNTYGTQAFLPFILWLLASMSTEPIAMHIFVFCLLGIGINNPFDQSVHREERLHRRRLKWKAE